MRPAKIQITHLHSLIKILSVRILVSHGCRFSSCRHRRLWSDCADAQADFSLRWANMSESTLSYLSLNFGNKRFQGHYLPHKQLYDGFFKPFLNIWSGTLETVPSDSCAKWRLKSACTVWSETSLSAWRNFAAIAIQKAPSKNSDPTAAQANRILCLAHMSKGTFPDGVAAYSLR